MAYEQTDHINALYRELFGRDAEQAGMQHWQSQIPTYGTGASLREAMMQNAQGADALYANNRGTSEADWSAYAQQAAQQDAGLNNMPGVLSDYGALATATPEQAQSMMYHDKDSLQKQLAAFQALFGVSSIDQLGGLAGASSGGRPPA